MKFIKENIYLLLLIGLPFLIFFYYYAPHTFLVGWDNIMPEFDVALNLKRTLMGVWQNYRGLGLYDGQSHISDLLHVVTVGFTSIFIPLENIRLFIISILYGLGGIGIFFLASKFIESKKVAFLTSLLYILNLGTIQQIFAPFDPYLYHFAFLPWTLVCVYNLLSGFSRSNLLMFFGVIVVSSPQFVIPTLFIPYILILGVCILCWSYKKNVIKHGIISFVLILVVNSFWLLPYSIGLSTKSETIRQSRINQYSSQETFLKNKERANLSDILLLKGFMLDIQEHDAVQGKTVSFMGAWNDLAESPLYLAVFVPIIGIFLSSFYFLKKKRTINPIAWSFLICFFALGTDIPIIRELHGLIRLLIPTLGEAFRLPFTKFITGYVLCFTLLFGYGFSKLSEMMEEKLKRAFFVVIFACILTLGFPIMQKQLFSPLLIRNMPTNYTQLFDYMKTQPHDTRVALLPSETFWPWRANDWGYVGSGFEWYGIPQPMMMRSFDPWSGYNEQFYEELHYAMNTENIELFNQVLKKYNIAYLILDSSTQDVLSSKPIKYDKIKDFILSSSDMKQDKVFGSLILFSRNSEYISSRITSYQKLPVLYREDFSPKDTNIDQSYAKIGPYVVSSNLQDSKFIHVFPDLFSQKNRSDSEVDIRKESSEIVLTRQINTIGGRHNLHVPAIWTYDKLIPVKFYREGTSAKLEIVNPQILVNNRQIDLPPRILDISSETYNRAFQIDANGITIREHELTYLHKINDQYVLIVDGSKKIPIRLPLDTLPEISYEISLELQEENSISISIPRGKSQYSIDNLFGQRILSKGIINKDTQARNLSTVDTSQNGASFFIKNQDEIGSVVYDIPPFTHDGAYILFVKAQDISGTPLQFWVDNYFENRSEYQFLNDSNGKENAYILPPSQPYYVSYALHFEARNVGGEDKVAKVSSASIFVLPYSMITQIYISKPENSSILTAPTQPEKAQPIDTVVSLPFLYSFRDVNNNTYISLDQAYDTHWLAYQVSDNSFLNTYFPFIQGKKINDHVLINNWANGWKISSSTCNLQLDTCNNHIVIFFWPQYLEYLGFILLGLTFVGILIYKGKSIKYKDNH